MRKPIALLFAAALILSVAGMANAATYTWTLVEGDSVALHWPNEANSPNVFEADGGLLGRIIPELATEPITPAELAAGCTDGPLATPNNAACTAVGVPDPCCTGLGTGTCPFTGIPTPYAGCTGVGTGSFTMHWNPDVPNVCELAPSWPCEANSPPTFLLPAGTAEGPSGAGGGDECNRVTVACGHTAPAAPDPVSHPFLDSRGVYSYLVIHTAAEGTVEAGKGIGFFSGTFVTAQDAYVCNDCPPTGKGHDENVGNIQCTGVGTPHSCCTGVGMGNCDFLSNTTIGAVVRTLSTSLWLTQSTPPFGHASVRLQVPPFAAGAGAGEVSVCGNGLTYQDLTTDLCSDGIEVGGNFTIPNQKTISHIYSITCTGKCNGPDCYIENVIIPAALAQDPEAKNVQVLSASSILPADAPGTLANGSVDSLLFMYTTQEINFDGDTLPDSCDPCPMDPSDSCLDGSPAGLTCIAGEVLCSDFDGNLACLPAYQCNVRGDLNGDCTSDIFDENLLKGVNDGIGGLEHWNTTLPIGPFDP